MQPDKPFSEQESLVLIGSMINKARNQFNENGHLYLLWGWVVLICSVSQFILLKVVQYPFHYRVWMLTWVAVIYQTIYLVRRKKKQKVRTYTDSLLGHVWLAFVITMILVGFQSGMAGGQPNAQFNAIILALYGIPTFLSGSILKFNPLKTGGIICWALAAAAPFLPGEYHLLLLATAVIAAWIVPGYLLQRRYEQQQSA